MGEEIALAGGNMGPVSRRGATVLRPGGPWSPAVHRLMEHCRAAGVTEVPRPLGFDEAGREIVEFLPGTVPAYPMPRWVWQRPALTSSADLLRRFHDASASADRAGPWRFEPREPAEVVCHSDFAPYNLVFRDGRAVGVIDLDFASPGPRIWDLAHLAYRVVPLSTDRADGFDDDERLDRLEALLRAYAGTDRLESTMSLTVSSVLETVIDRLRILAGFSRHQSVEQQNPELYGHAELYDRDVAYVRGLLDSTGVGDS